MMNQNEPLAERMRPLNLSDYVGQEHLLGENGILRRILLNKLPLPSMLLWGPPGVGKTTLAHIIAAQTDSELYSLSAIASGVKDVREVIDSAAKQGGLLSKPILFIDEIHRFSKSQQDSLLGAVEKGIVTLIGATTENPSFEVIPALISRCQVYTLEPLNTLQLRHVLDRAMSNDRFLRFRTIELEECEALFRYSGGDARKLLNLFELTVNSIESDDKPVSITNAKVMHVLQHNAAFYDKNGEQHYDIISAFIKSVRGSDPNAALYYLARMIVGGEDPKFIARRMILLASEDIGLANPNALMLATSCFQAVSVIGYPECDLILGETAIYLACSPKSNTSYTGIRGAIEFVRQTGDLPIPLHLRNAPTALMKELGYGVEYKYAHSYEGNFIEQEFLPESISGKVFYVPGENTREKEIRDLLCRIWKGRFGY
jgi:putative ATPase